MAERSSQISRPAFILLFATVLLTLILAVATINNMDRGMQLMRLSFTRQGTAVIHSFEAGARTSMLFRRATGHNPLVDLAKELLKHHGISYIRIVDEKNVSVVEEGYTPDELKKDAKEIQKIGLEPAVTINWHYGIFDITKQFLPFESSPETTPMMMRRWEQWHLMHQPSGKMHISIGLKTDEFEEIRTADFYHTLFMLAMLVLLFLSGVYFLHLYRRMRQTHATLINTRLYTDNILESMPDGLITLDTGQRVVSCNIVAEELLGSGMADIQGKRISGLLPDWSQKGKDRPDDLLDITIDNVNKEGERIPIRIRSASLIDHQGASIGSVLLLRDIREIRKMELQLERSRRLVALGGMAAGIAHEVRNPLGTLRGFAQFFGAEPGASEACQKYSGLMVSEVDRLDQLVAKLLQFSSPRELEICTIDAEMLREKIGVLMQSDFRTRKIAFSSSCQKECTILADENLLIQVLLNLLKNSLYATDSGGSINLDFTCRGGETQISVSDTGCGMTEEIQTRMFDPFFTARKEGTGLGLAVCHSIIEQHHGQFEVRSLPEAGTTITIILPR